MVTFCKILYKFGGKQDRFGRESKEKMGSAEPVEPDSNSDSNLSGILKRLTLVQVGETNLCFYRFLAVKDFSNTAKVISPYFTLVKLRRIDLNNILIVTFQVL